MSKVLTQIKYTQIVRDIKMIIQRGREDIKKNAERRRIETNWKVGQYLTESFPLDELPKAENAEIIGHLAREFCQPRIYFSTVIKFYKSYPDLSLENNGLSWADYKALLTVNNQGQAKGSEQISIKRDIPSEHFHRLVIHDKW